MKIAEIYAIPVDEDGWRLLPGGNRLMIGPNVQAPDGINLSFIGDGARIGERAIIGERARIGDGAEFKKSPLAVQGSRGIAIQHSPGKIAVECEVHTYAQWKRRYKSIGKANGYTPEEIEEYGRILDFMIANSAPAEEK